MVSGRWKRKDERDSRKRGVNVGYRKRRLGARTICPFLGRGNVDGSRGGTRAETGHERSARAYPDTHIKLKVVLVGNLVDRKWWTHGRRYEPRPMPVTSETWNAKLGESFVLIGLDKEGGRESVANFRADSLLELVRIVRTAHSDNECRALSSHLLCVRLFGFCRSCCCTLDRGRGSEDRDR